MQLDRLVSSYCSLGYYHLRVIGRVRHLLTRGACQAAVRSFVLSRLNFRNGLFGGLNYGQFNRLQRVQNSAARHINRIRRREHITQILQSLHWLPIRMRVFFKICTYIFKIMHDLAPDYLNCVVVCYVPTRALRSACDTTLLKVAMSKKTIGQSNFAVTGPRLWNNLPKCV